MDIEDHWVRAAAFSAFMEWLGGEDDDLDDIETAEEFMRIFRSRLEAVPIHRGKED